MQQYGAKRLQGLGYLRRLGGLPEGVLAAGQTGSSLVFLFGVIGVDAGKAANHPSIQVSKYPGAEFDPRAVPDSYDAVCCADPQSSSYGPPMWTVLGGPFRCLPGSLLGSIAHAACRMRALGALLITCPL